MGTILGKAFPQAQVHTVHSTLSQDCPHGEIRQTFLLKKFYFNSFLTDYLLKQHYVSVFGR